MTLNVSLDGGSTWSIYTPGLIDFEQYPTLRLRFVDADNEEELPSWIASIVLCPKECTQRPLDASIHVRSSRFRADGQTPQDLCNLCLLWQ